MKVKLEVARKNRYTGVSYALVTLDDHLLESAALARYKELYQTDESDSFGVKVLGVDTSE
jgi:hypothetical protein